MTKTSPLLALALLFAAGCNEISVTNINDGTTPGECFLDVPPAGTIPTDPQCGAVPEVNDPWAVTEEWTFLGGGDDQELQRSYAPPLVARILDSNDDGVLDDNDHPNIVVIAYENTREGSVVVLDGVTREKVLDIPGVHFASGHSLADINGDGWTEIVVFDASGRVVALDRDGEMIWRTTASVDSPYPQSTVADLDGDGTVEVIADNLILEGATGQVRAELIVRDGLPYTMPVVGDIDIDGKQEIIYGNTVHNSEGQPLWATNIRGDYGHFSAIVNADEDLEGEVLMLGASKMLFFEHDGTPIFDTDLPRRAGSPPCLADFDGDGASEIAFALTDGSSSTSSLFRVYELDGTLVWSREVNDSSGIAGCSGYDFDGDGIVEILYADQTDLYVFDGPTGDVRYRNSDHASGTVYEYPVVADVDMDDAAEVLFVRSPTDGQDGFELLSVLGHDGAGWAPTSSVWPIHDFAVTNILPDATVPEAAPLYWVEHNTYRARPVIDANPVDWQVAIPDVCTEGCTSIGTARIGVQVWNQGPAPLPAGTGVTLWRSDEEGEHAVTTHTLDAALPGRVYNVVFEVPIDDVRPGDIYVRVDDVGTGAGIWPECFEDNNVATWGPVTCGE